MLFISFSFFIKFYFVSDIKKICRLIIIKWYTKIENPSLYIISFLFLTYIKKEYI